ncbi:MAG: hypothetical protein HYV07_02835 [Deltaproteobacteria bacterium]|nr:hypothetical protein [Deltaproteobacteria bacterium]
MISLGSKKLNPRYEGPPSCTLSGNGSARLGKDGRLKGTIRIMDGDSSTFTAVRAEEPDEPIRPPSSYRDKWRRRW